MRQTGRCITKQIAAIRFLGQSNQPSSQEPKRYANVDYKLLLFRTWEKGGDRTDMSMLSMVSSCVGAWKAGVCLLAAIGAPIPRKRSERARTHQHCRAHLEAAALCTKTKELLQLTSCSFFDRAWPSALAPWQERCTR